MLGRTETRTRDRIYCQTMRTVRDISRDDRARIATCSLRTPTDRQTDRLNVNYSIDDIRDSAVQALLLECENRAIRIGSRHRVSITPRVAASYCYSPRFHNHRRADAMWNDVSV